MNTPPSFIDSAFADPASLAAAARLRVVLVGTQHPGNIGAAARALKTMGLARLVLVAPEDYPAEEAYRRAAGADDLLGDAPVVDTRAEAVADCHLVLGCTARSRRVQLEEHAPRQAAAVAVARAAAGGEVALVFGRERTGLSNEELQLCHAAVHIPANPGYSSLNLAAAVQVLAYELRLALLEGAAPATAEPVVQTALFNKPAGASAARPVPQGKRISTYDPSKIASTMPALNPNQFRKPVAPGDSCPK